jgi:hypothetical protein
MKPCAMRGLETGQCVAHEVTNRGPTAYEGSVDVDERIVIDLVAACETVGDTLV